MLLSVMSRYWLSSQLLKMTEINDFAMSWRKPITEEHHLTNRIQSMSTNNSAVAVFHTHAKAEDAVREVQKSGFDMTKLSIVGKDYHTDEHVVGYYNAGDRMKYWGKAGAIWGGFWSLLFGSAFFAIPGLGPVLVAGPLVAAIVAVAEGAVVVGGVSALGAAMMSIGIPNNSVLQYETELKNDRLLLVVHGTADEIETAKNVLSSHGVDVDVHDAPEAIAV